MKVFCALGLRLLGSGLIIATLLNGCASSVSTEEQEGGITGTGDNINCEEEQNRKRKECIGEI